MAVPILATIMDGVEGLHPSMFLRQVPFWQTGANVVFRNGSVRKMKGWTAPLTKPAANPVRGMGQLKTDTGVQWLFWGDATNLYGWNTVSVGTLGSGYTGKTTETVADPVSHWDFANWGNWMVATNDVDAVQVWKGSSFAALSGTTFTRARTILKYGAHLLAFNTSNGGQQFEWCSEDNIELWTPAADNSAGNMFIRDMESDILAAVPLGDKIAVYGKNTVHLVSYIRAPFYFGVLPALTGVGAVGKKAVVSVDRKNYGLSAKGFFVTDGVQVQFLDDPDVRDYFLSRVNVSQISKTVAYHDLLNSQVVWYYPTSGGENTEGLGYDYARGKWTIYSFGRTAAIGQNVFSYPVAGHSDGSIFFHNFGDDANGSALVPYLQSKPFAFETPQQINSANLIKYVDSLKLMLSELTGTVSVKIGTQLRLTDAVTWTDYQSINASMAPAYFRRSARYFTFYITSTAVGDTWELNGIDVMGKAIGGGL